MWTHRLHSWLLFFSALWSPPVHRTPAAFAQRPMNVLEDDYGNRADNASNLVFADYNKTAKYDTPDDLAVTDEGFLPFYRMARSIAKSTFGSEYPYGLVDVIWKEPWAVSKILSESSERFKFCLILACLLLALFLLLALYIPCYLCCAPCCRRKRRPAPSTCRVTSVGVLVILLIGVFSMVGLAGVYKALGHSKPVREQLRDNTLSGLRDLKTYVSFSTEEILFIFKKGNFTKQVFDRDLEDIGALMSRYDDVQSQLEEAVDTLNQTGVAAQDSYWSLKALDTKLDQAMENLTALHSTLNKTACTSCSPPLLLNITKPNYTAAESSLSILDSTNLSALIQQEITEVSSIPERIKNVSSAQVTELEDNLQTHLQKLRQFRDVVHDVRDKILTTIKFGDFERSLRRGFAEFGAFDKARVTAQHILLLPELLAMVLMVTGAVMIMWVYRKRKKAIAAGFEPQNHCNTVLAEAISYVGIGAFAVYSWLWVLFAIVLFVMGTLNEVLVCSVVQDPNYVMVDEVVERLAPQHGKAWLGKNVLAIPNSTATIGSIVRDCRDDKTLFKAVQLDKHPSANFTALIQFLDKLNISSIISSINVTGSETDLFSGSVDSYLNTSAAVWNLTPITDLWMINKTIDDYRRQARRYYENTSTLAVQAIKDEIDQRHKNLDQLQIDIQAEVVRLNDSLQMLTTKAASARQMVNATDIKISRGLREGPEHFVKRLSKIIRSFINESQENLFEDYGKCRPLYNIVNSLLNKSVCGNLANLLNGGWLAIYWLLIFLLAAAIASIILNRLIPLQSPPEPPPFFPQASPEPSPPPLQPRRSTLTLGTYTSATTMPTLSPSYAAMPLVSTPGRRTSPARSTTPSGGPGVHVWPPAGNKVHVWLNIPDR